MEDWVVFVIDLGNDEEDVFFRGSRQDCLDEAEAMNSFGNDFVYVAQPASTLYLHALNRASLAGTRSSDVCYDDMPFLAYDVF